MSLRGGAHIDLGIAAVRSRRRVSSAPLSTRGSPSPRCVSAPSTDPNDVLMEETGYLAGARRSTSRPVSGHSRRDLRDRRNVLGPDAVAHSSDNNDGRLARFGI